MLVASLVGADAAYTKSVMANKIVAQVIKTGRIDYYGNERRIQATAQLHDLGQGPYFSITGEIGSSHDPECCGCIHEEIARAFPDLVEYLKWHGAHIDRGPWYYCENAKYWAGWQGWADGKDTSPPNLQHLKTTVVWGLFEGETDEALQQYMNPYAEPGMLPHAQKSLLSQAADADKLVEMLKARHSKLMEVFHADMARLFAGQVTANGEDPTLPSLAIIRADYEAKLKT